MNRSSETLGDVSLEIAPCLTLPKKHIAAKLSFADAAVPITIKETMKDFRGDPFRLLVGILISIDHSRNARNLKQTLSDSVHCGKGTRLPNASTPKTIRNAPTTRPGKDFGE